MKEIPGYESRYAITTEGHVYSLRRGKRIWSRYLSGYEAVELYDGESCRSVRVHRLVMLTYVGPCPEKHEVNHKNGIRSDNRLENLESRSLVGPIGTESVLERCLRRAELCAKQTARPGVRLTQCGLANSRLRAYTGQ